MLHVAARAEVVTAAPGFQLIATVTTAPGAGWPLSLLARMLRCWLAWRAQDCREACPGMRRPGWPLHLSLPTSTPPPAPPFECRWHRIRRVRQQRAGARPAWRALPLRGGGAALGAGAGSHPGRAVPCAGAPAAACHGHAGALPGSLRPGRPAAAAAAAQRGRRCGVRGGGTSGGGAGSRRAARRRAGVQRWAPLQPAGPRQVVQPHNLGMEEGRWEIGEWARGPVLKQEQGRGRGSRGAQGDLQRALLAGRRALELLQTTDGVCGLGLWLAF